MLKFLVILPRFDDFHCIRRAVQSPRIGNLAVGYYIIVFAGAFIVFEIGAKLRQKIKKWSTGTMLTKKIVGLCERFVKNYGYIGLFIIMSIPLMIDSVSLYLFSLLNPQEDKKTALRKSKFILINILAGAVRGCIILIVAHFAGLRLV